MANEIECTIFEDQCKLNPRAVIDALVKQTTRQGAEIHRLQNIVNRIESRVSDTLFIRLTQECSESPPF